MEELRTYQTLAPGTEPTLATTGFAKTNWIYSPTRGFLTGKRDATNKGTDYTHTDAGRVLTRTWARSTVASPQITTYGYDAGMMTSTAYSDTTPDVVTSYDTFGRTLTVKNGVGTLVSGVFTIATPLSSSTFAYDPTTLVVDTETVTYDLDTNGTPELTRVIDRKQDSLLRDKGFDLKNGPTIENAATYTYGLTDGRLSQISNPQISNLSFTYDYLTNSNLIEKVTGPIHDVVNLYEPNRDVLDTKTNKLAITVISAYDYAVNAIGQRTGVTTSGTAFPALPAWIWGYDSLGQVTRADSSLNTSDRAYEYDAIGNRKKSANSLTLPSTDNYTTNALNQYTSRSVGVSPTLNPVYDFDGNAEAYPIPAAPNENSTLIWDAENRLTEVKNSAGTTLEQNIYDSGSRKIATTVNGVTILYLYDAWNCIAEYEGGTGVSPVLKKTRLWGLDLSGTLQGAGGVGGLLVESQISNSQISNYYPTYDGNGNVSEMLDSTGQVTTHYEYDPFGNTVVNTDTSNQFAYRFSTKPLDFVTGLYYYGYRWYDPLTGRWPSRDPIGERGGVNLYVMVTNRTLGAIDPFGLAEKGESPPKECTALAVFGHGTPPEGFIPKRDPIKNPIPDTIHDHFKKGKSNGYAGVTYAGCNANELNKRVPENQRIPDTDQTENPPRNQIYPESCEEYKALIDKKIEAAEKSAKTYCAKDCCKGKKWGVELQLLHDLFEETGEGTNQDKKTMCTALNEMNGKIVKEGTCPK